MTETNRVSETSRSYTLKHLTMERVQKPSHSVCYIHHRQNKYTEETVCKKYEDDTAVFGDVTPSNLVDE
jgi:hypothetical protein